MFLILGMMAIRDKEIGTWMVKAVTDVLDALQKDIDLLTFVTSVQKIICYQQNSCRYSIRGQTPEIRIFPNCQISICRSHNDPYEHPLISPKSKP